MDGPSHYMEAENSFEKARQAAAATDGASAVLYMQAAQWHATMALVAAVTATIPRWLWEWEMWEDAVYNPHEYRHHQPEPQPSTKPESHTALGEIAGFETGLET